MNHAWTASNDLVAFYLERFGTERHSLKDAGARLGIPAAAMRMRMANFRALEGEGGLSNASRQSQAVFQRYREATEPELRRRVDGILGRGGA